MQNFRKNAIKANKPISMRIVNYTGKELWTYTNEGSLMHISGEQEQAEIPAPRDNACIVVGRDTYERLRQSGRSTTDLAYIVSAGTSYDRRPLSYLYTYDDHIRVMPPERLN